MGIDFEPISEENERMRINDDFGCKDALSQYERASNRTKSSAIKPDISDEKLLSIRVLLAKKSSKEHVMDIFRNYT